MPNHSKISGIEACSKEYDPHQTFFLLPTNMLPIKYALSWRPLGCVWTFAGRRRKFYFPNFKPISLATLTFNQQHFENLSVFCLHANQPTVDCRPFWTKSWLQCVYCVQCTLYMYMYAFFILLYISLISEWFKFIYIQSTFESSRFFVSLSNSSWVFHCILKFKTTTKRSCYQLRAHQDLAGLLRGPGKKCHRQISFQVLPEEKVKPRLLGWVGLGWDDPKRSVQKRLPSHKMQE